MQVWSIASWSPLLSSGYPSAACSLTSTSVEFTGLTALAYVDDSGTRPRVAWSFRAQAWWLPARPKSPQPIWPATAAMGRPSGLGRMLPDERRGDRPDLG